MIISLTIPLTTFLHQELVNYSKRFQRYLVFLKKSNTNTFFLSPTTHEEVLNELKTLNLNEANGPNSISVEILKDIKSEISITINLAPEIIILLIMH